MTFSKADLRTIHTSLGRLLPPGSLPCEPEELVEIGRVLGVVASAMHAAANVFERGIKVLEWRLPQAHAPTLNEYAYKKTWMKVLLRKDLAASLAVVLPQWPRALLHGAQRKRWARVTRFSSLKMDDVSIDVIGGKMPIDTLVHGGVLADDRGTLLHREPRWAPTVRGNIHLLIEVYELAAEGTGCTDEPKDATVVQIVRKKKKGVLAKALAQ